MSTMRILFAILAVAVTTTAVKAQDYLLASKLTAHQQQQLDAEISRLWKMPRGSWQRSLFAHCDPLFPVILGGPQSEFKPHMPIITAAVESRLRAARLYVEKGYQSLQVTVSLGAGTINVSIAVRRYVKDAGGGIAGVVSVWQTGFFGGAPTETSILEAVSMGTDQFLAKYLRVNDVACRMKWAQSVKDLKLGPELDYDPFAKQ